METYVLVGTQQIISEQMPPEHSIAQHDVIVISPFLIKKAPPRSLALQLTKEQKHIDDLQSKSENIPPPSWL